MSRQRTTFREALTKQIGFCATCLLAIVALGYVLFPLNTLTKNFLFSAFVIFSGVVCFLLVRRTTYKVTCANCGANLYHLIEGHGPVRLKVNFCPTCGAEVDA